MGAVLGRYLGCCVTIWYSGWCITRRHNGCTCSCYQIEVASVLQDHTVDALLQDDNECYITSCYNGVCIIICRIHAVFQDHTMDAVLEDDAMDAILQDDKMDAILPWSSWLVCK